MKKFKVGDKVILIRPKWGFDKVGDEMEVSQIFKYGRIVCIRFSPYSDNKKWFYSEGTYVLKEVYNSPLYKAMSEQAPQEQEENND